MKDAECYSCIHAEDVPDDPLCYYCTKQEFIDIFGEEIPIPGFFSCMWYESARPKVKKPEPKAKPKQKKKGWDPYDL
jgi:hypothetical protein